jgi:chromosome segregation ATPase
MRILVRVVNILILLLAVAAAVFTFMLFKKRDELVKGWGKMSEAVSSTSAALDKGSGTKVASKLSPQSLDHKNFKDLDNLLPNLKKQADDVIKQRDSLSMGLKDVASTLRLPEEIQPDDLKAMDKYEAKKTELLGGVAKVKERNDVIVSEVVSASKKLDPDPKLNSESLKDNAKYKSEVSKLGTSIQSQRSKTDAFGKYISNIASELDLSPKPDLSSEGYSASLPKNMDAVKAYKSNYLKTKNELVQKSDELNKTKQSMTELKTAFDSLTNNSSEKDSTIASLKKCIRELTNLDTDSDSQIKILQPGDPQIMRLVKGRVIQTSDKWNFVVLDLGADSKVSQQIGSKSVSLPIMLPLNEDMVVARLSDDKSECDFVGRVNLSKIFGDYSIANLALSPRGRSPVQPGDLVFFSDDVIKKYEEKRKAAPSGATAEAETAAKDKEKDKEKK